MQTTKKPYYDLDALKRLPISDYLQRQGITPTKSYAGYALYYAPYREDSTASLKVDTRQNLWYDFGLGRDGCILDLVMLMRACTLHEAMTHLAEGQAQALPFHCEALKEPHNNRHIISITEDLPQDLQDYLTKERGIDLRFATPFLRSIRYEVRGRMYSALGFPNNSGGYELRDSRVFKGTIAPKDISLLITSTPPDALCLFEGFMDCLTWLTMQRVLSRPCLVLNSVSHIRKAITYICTTGITAVRAFLDNDEAGRSAFSSLSGVKGLAVEDMRPLYAPHKDLNEYWVAQLKAKQAKKQENSQPKRKLK